MTFLKVHPWQLPCAGASWWRRPLAAEPELLLLDEPFTGVDVPSQEHVNELSGRLAGEGGALLRRGRRLRRIWRVCKDLEVPTPQAHGIDKDYWFRQSSLTAEQALASGAPANNPALPAPWTR